MVTKAGTFTPQVLLSAPRRSAGVPNQAGTHVLYTQSTYSFEDHKKRTELRCLETKTTESRLITDEEGLNEPLWLEGENDTFVCLKSGKESTTEVVTCKLGSADSKAEFQVAGHIDAPASSLKIAKLGDGKYAIVVAAQASPDGSLFNPEKQTKTQSTGKLYKSLFVRHWDHYATKEKNSLWYGTLQKSSDGKYSMSGLTNALKGTKLESPIPAFGGTDHFDVSQSGIIFVSKDPELNPALNTRCVCYLVELSTFEESTPPKPFDYSIPGYDGACTSPVFSPDGTNAAYLQMKTNGYEADQNEIVLIVDVKDAKSASVAHTAESKKSWDRSPGSIVFSSDGKMLLCPTEDQGTSCLFGFPIRSDYKGPLPVKLTSNGSVSDVKPLSGDRVFISGSTLVDYSSYGIIEYDLEKNRTSRAFEHSASRDGGSLGLSRSQVSSIRFPASDPSVNKEVHAFVMTPSHFDKSKKYPLAMLIHGGPQGAWGDSWSTRWNPAVFAEQGYVVVFPNVTGSTGYGQAFTDAIRRDWGGAPYEDIVNCFKHISDNMPFVDTDRAVALGASYGGFMMNWINGHDLGKKFKALVNHDGVFSMAGQLASDELYFPFHDLGGQPWSSASATNPAGKVATKLFGDTTLDTWQKNDPSHHLSEWSTPSLIIHNAKDYRLSIAEGLSAFNVLQAKGIESQFLTFPDENHWVLKPENSLVWHKVVLNWINKFVGLPRFSNEDDEEEEVAFLGGVKESDKDDGSAMPTMGDPGT